MTIADAAGWIAPAATMLAAMMTAANLGARVTGWGFVVFVVGSLGWSAVGLASGQTNLLWANGFLTLVNLVGVWRWLGREARYAQGGAVAARRSATAAQVPSLFSANALAGAPVAGRDGRSLGTVIDAMAARDSGAIVYVVISEGGVAGVGERLHAVPPAQCRFTAEGIALDLDAQALAALPVLEADRWPARPPA